MTTLFKKGLFYTNSPYSTALPRVVRVPVLQVPVLLASRTRWTGGTQVFLAPPGTVWNGGTQSFQQVPCELAGLRPFSPHVPCGLEGLSPFSRYTVDWWNSVLSAIRYPFGLEGRASGDYFGDFDLSPSLVAEGF